MGVWRPRTDCNVVMMMTVMISHDCDYVDRDYGDRDKGDRKEGNCDDDGRDDSEW